MVMFGKGGDDVHGEEARKECLCCKGVKATGPMGQADCGSVQAKRGRIVLMQLLRPNFAANKHPGMPVTLGPVSTRNSAGRLSTS